MCDGDGLEDGLCYFHSKVKRGLINPKDVLRTARRGVGAGDVLTDEQRALVAGLRKLGAPEHVIEAALAREQRMPSGGRRGTGARAGRVSA